MSLYAAGNEKERHDKRVCLVQRYKPYLPVISSVFYICFLLQLASHAGNNILLLNHTIPFNYWEQASLVTQGAA